MKSLYRAIPFLVIMTILIIPFTSCTSASELLPLSNNPAKADDYNTLSDRLNKLEERVTYLERGLDERVIEYNVVQSALWHMIVENKFNRIPGNSFPYTNDMRQFPSPAAPLYGFDTNNDGKSDTNYVPFDKTVWFYRVDDYIPEAIVQGADPKLIERLVAGRDKTQAAATELHNIQTAVLAAMADTSSANITAGTFDDDHDIIVSGEISVGDFIVGYGNGGNGAVHGTYSVAANGKVTQNAYP